VSEDVLATGASLRMTGPRDGRVVLCVNGGTARERPGTWSANVEYLVGQLAPALPDIGFAEVRYRVRSWKQLDMCIDDGSAAIATLVAAGAREVVLLGYSMGGAVATAIAGHASVRRVIGLAPWLPERLPMPGMRGKRFDVFHGSLDRYLPGIPGVSPTSSRAGFDRLSADGTTGTYTLIPGAIHAIAVRAPWGKLIPVPHARRWADHVRSVLAP
jgi:pimeloyl-ACP methyl ester carboxylesterase